MRSGIARGAAVLAALAQAKIDTEHMTEADVLRISSRAGRAALSRGVRQALGPVELERRARRDRRARQTHPGKRNKR